MIKFIFYTLITYVLFKVFRLFIDPMFEIKSAVKQQPKQTTTKEPKVAKETVLGEYVEYEEVK
jgi:hypothetical protein